MFPLFTGLTFHAAALSVRYLSAESVAAWRFGIAAVLMLALLFAKRDFQLHVFKTNWRAYLLLGIVGIFGFNVLFFLGMAQTSPVNGALIMATNPFLSTLLARLLLGDRITGRQIAGIALSFTGVLLVLSHGSWELIRTFSFQQGDILLFLGNLCWALYGVLTRKFVRGSTPMMTTTTTMTIGAIGMVLVAPFGHNAVTLAQVPLSAWGAVLFMAVFTSVIGYLWWNQAVAVIGVSKTAIFFNLTPIITLLTSALLGEAVTGAQLGGTALVLAGVLSSSGMTIP
ncbi:MAG: DMT family transporter, partial [Tumebacillaceae bacterium]